MLDDNNNNDNHCCCQRNEQNEHRRRKMTRVRHHHDQNEMGEEGTIIIKKGKVKNCARLITLMPSYDESVSSHRET